MKSYKDTATILTIICIVFLAAGAILTFFLKGDFTPQLISIGAIAIIIFFAFFMGNKLSDAKEKNMRNAIASAIVLPYILLVVTFSFQVSLEGTIPAMADKLLTSFTPLVGIVVAFYFGATAYVETHSKNKSKDTEEDKSE
jgi:peptidoglycan/LPS O-acetylase OafA/YrhL